MGILSWVTGWPGESGFGSSTTAEEVTQGIDASNLTAIVTGGASGIGAETARVLALRGAHVIIAARNSKAAEETKQQIQEGNPSARVHTMELDLNSFKSIREFASNFNSSNLSLNILINNAGVMFCPFQLSEDGIEMQFATNHLGTPTKIYAILTQHEQGDELLDYHYNGHFLLTNLLLDKMKASAKKTGVQGRIVNLSSIAHRGTYPGGIRFDKINERSEYFDKLAYGQSKLANILHANELSRRLKEEDANITANSLHPGIIMTNLMRHSTILMGVFRVFTFLIWKNVPQGAATTSYVALHPNLEGVTGKYFTDCNEGDASSYAKDEELAKQLWNFSEKLIKISGAR